MNPISLLKNVVNGDLFDANRFNQDQSAIEDAINKFSQSITDGDSGADNIKATAISTSPETVQGILEWIYSALQNVTLGQIPNETITNLKLVNETITYLKLANNTITNGKLATDIKIGSLASLTTSTKSSIQAAINELVTSISTINTTLVPVGHVITVAMSTAPTGYLKCNGAAISRATYSALFSAIGTTYGAGDGSSTFNVPDLRGEFVRGWDDGRGIDNARNFGTAQAEATKAHTHTGTTASEGAHAHTFQLHDGAGSYGYPAPDMYSPNPTTVSTSTAGAHTHTFTTDSTGGTETRPRNVALLYCIKY